MRLRVLPYTIGLIALLREIRYTSSQMKEQPHAAPLLPSFLALRDEWKVILAEEVGILEEISDAQAAVDRADNKLDRFAGRVWRAVDDATDGKTKKTLKTALFKGLPLSKFRRPVLGGQLAIQSGWAATLAQSGVDELAKFAPEAATLVQAGEDASTLRAKALQKNRQFRDVGARKQFIDKVNALRQDAAGKLERAQFEDPSLPSDFADGFFYGQAPKDEEESIDDVKASITALLEQVEERKALLATMEAEAEAAAKLEEARLAQQQERDALLAQKAELEKKIAALDLSLDK